MSLFVSVGNLHRQEEWVQKMSKKGAKSLIIEDEDLGVLPESSLSGWC